jgi:hypothetical protein
MAHFLDKKGIATETLRMEIRKSPAVVQEYISFLEGKLHKPTVSVSVCPECGCNKLQDDGLDYRSCLNILCEWNGQIGR